MVTHFSSVSETVQSKTEEKENTNRNQRNISDNNCFCGVKPKTHYNAQLKEWIKTVSVGLSFVFSGLIPFGLLSV